MRKGIRIWALLILAAVTILVRVIDISEVAVRGTHPWMALRFFTDVSNNRLVVQEVSPTDFDGRPNRLYESGLQIGDRLIEIRDVEGVGYRITGFRDYGDAMRSILRADPWSLIVSREVEGRFRQVRLRVAPPDGYGFRTWLIFWGLSLVCPLITIATGYFIGLARPDDDNAFTASLLLLSFSSYFTLNHFAFPPVFREIASFYQVTLVSFLPFLFMRFFLLFPTASLIDRKLPLLKKVCLVVTLLVFASQVYFASLIGESFARLGKIPLWVKLIAPLQPLMPIMFLIGVTSLLLNTLAASRQADRRRMNILLLGTLIGLGPLILLVTWVRLFGTFAWEAFFIAFAALILFPLSFAYAVIRHQVMGVQLIVRRGLQYAFVSKGFLVVEWLLLYLVFSFAVNPLLQEYVPGSAGIVTAAGAAFAVFGVWAINKRAMPLIDRHFFREAYNTQQILTRLSHDVRNLATHPNRLLKTVVDTVSDSLYPDQVALFLRGAEEHSERRGPTFDPQSGAGFRCLWHRVRTPRPRSGEILRLDPTDTSPSPQVQRLWLADDAFIPSYLQQSAADGPEALEVYFDDPRSWAQALTQSDAGEERGREKDLLFQLNTRLIVPLLGRYGVLGFLSLGEKLSEEPYSQEDKQLLLTVAEQTGIALDYASLIEQAAEQESVKRDLEIAKEVQNSLLPKAPRPLSSLQYTGVCLSARGVGGDYYDFLPEGQEGLYLALGDISGKGISAALLMASLQAVLHSRKDVSQGDVRKLISDINLLMCSNTHGSKYATFFCGLYDNQERTLTYVNAGHNPPMLFRTEVDGSNERETNTETLAVLDSSPTIRLQTGGTVIGLFEDSTYEQETIRLDPGDVLVVFSDGVSEARNEAGEEFGEGRLERIVRNNIERPAVDLCDIVVDEIREFSGLAPQHDDLTIVVAKAMA